MFPDEASRDFTRFMAHENGYPCNLVDIQKVNDTLYDLKVDIPFDVWEDEDPEEVALSIIETHLDADGDPWMIGDDITEGVPDEE
jgi:hypothetical protein